MAEPNDITGWAVPVAAHGRELGAHDQPRVRGAAHQGVLSSARHRVQVEGSQGGSAVLPGRILRSRRTHRPLPARSPSVKLRLGMRKGRAEKPPEQFLVVRISRPEKRTSFNYIVIWTPFEKLLKLSQIQKSLIPNSVTNEHCLDRPQD